MTRSEFLENVTDWSELIEFCRDEDCDICEDVYDEESRDDVITERIVDWARNADSWQDLADRLSEITTGYDYYSEDDYGDWNGLTDSDFEDYKTDVLDWMDNNDYWDEDEDEDEEEEYYEPPTDPEDEIPVAEEAVPLEELFATCSGQLNTISANENAREEAEAAELEAFVEEIVVVERSSI